MTVLSGKRSVGQRKHGRRSYVTTINGRELRWKGRMRTDAVDMVRDALYDVRITCRQAC